MIPSTQSITYRLKPTKVVVVVFGVQNHSYIRVEVGDKLKALLQNPTNVLRIEPLYTSIIFLITVFVIGKHDYILFSLSN